MKLLIRNNPLNWIYLFFFFITLSGARYFYEHNYYSIIEVVAFLFLFIGLFFYNRKNKSYVINFFSVVIFFFFIIGIIFQDLPVLRKISLISTMFIIWSCIFLSKNIINSFAYIRNISYTIFFSSLLIIILSIIVNESYLFEISHDKIFFYYGFTGGVIYKNYFATNMLIVFIGLFLYGKFVKLKIIDLFFVVISLCMLLFTESKGVYALLLLFIFVMNLDKLKFLNKEFRNIFLFFLFFLLFLVGLVFYQEIALKSSTYLYRIRGLLNYLEYYSGDYFHLFFGNAENAYDKELSYVMSIRVLIGGFDGSFEFAWLNVLIKNGLLGIISFISVFIMYFINAINKRDWNYKIIELALLTILIASSFVETYIQSCHALFGLYSYLLLSGYSSFRDKS